VLALVGASWLGRELRAHPAPSARAVLRTDGPYARMRHPIYAGLLLGAGGVAVLRARPEPLLSVALLAGLLNVKAAYEERLLLAQFGAAYEAYAARAPRFVPRLPHPPWRLVRASGRIRPGQEAVGPDHRG
jgi:protein-S-isoprenylcysteine O-methyltransferase Ste14